MTVEEARGAVAVAAKYLSGDKLKMMFGELNALVGKYSQNDSVKTTLQMLCDAAELEPDLTNHRNSVHSIDGVNGMRP